MPGPSQLICLIRPLKDWDHCIPATLGKKGASVSMSPVSYLSWFQGMRNISLSIQKQPGSNVVAVVDQIKELLPTLRAQLPPSLSLDRSAE